MAIVSIQLRLRAGFMRFTKMHGLGNDYVYVNCFDESLPADIPQLSRAVSNRHTGIGADGLILIGPSEIGDARMQMFNADGSRGEMCGNGIRCVGKYVYDHGIAKKEELNIETDIGVLTMQLSRINGRIDQVRVNMGKPILTSADIPTTLAGDPPVMAELELADRKLSVTCVSMGNPHCVTFVDQATDELVLEVGPQVECHAAFPNRVNVEFIQVLSPTEFNMRVWERGSGETQACGTGACASAVAGVLAGMTERTVLAHLLGGDLHLEWAESNEVFMTGPAVEVFSGEWPDGS